LLYLCLAITLSADDLATTEKSFGCVLKLPKVRNTRIQNPDPEKLTEAALKVSADGTTILDRGDKVLNTSLNKPCPGRHSPAAKFDFVCEKGHGCAPIPVTDRQIAAMQSADPRCRK